MESFNEPALTLMTEGVSDGKLICLRESEMASKRFMCVCVYMWEFWGTEWMCLCRPLSDENSQTRRPETF